MPETKTWVKLGRTTWRVEVAGGDDGEPRVHTFRQRECRSRSEARRRIARSTSLHVYGGIQGGTYQGESFDDPGYGPVRDAGWDDDGRPGACCCLTDTGVVAVEWYKP